MKPFEVFDILLHAMIFFRKTFLFAREAFLKADFKLAIKLWNVCSSLFTLSLFMSSSKTEIQRCYHAHHEWSYKGNFIPPSICLLTHIYEARSMWVGEHCIQQNHKTFCSFWFKWIVVQFLFQWLTLYKCLRNAFAGSELNGQYMVA